MRNVRRITLGICMVLIIALIGISFAFFEYYKEGRNQKMTAGQIFLVFNENGPSIKAPNIFPQTKEEARLRTDNIVNFVVSGINTNEEHDIYYEITLNEGDPEIGMTRFKPEHIVFDLIEIDEVGNKRTVVDAMSYSDFNEKRIWVNTINHNTKNTITRTYSLRMWLSEDVMISDSSPDASYSTDVFANSYASIKIAVFGDFEEKSLSN